MERRTVSFYSKIRNFQPLGLVELNLPDGVHKHKHDDDPIEELVLD